MFKNIPNEQINNEEETRVSVGTPVSSLVVNLDKSKVSYTYDKLNRQTGETLEDGKVRTTAYDDKKNTIRTADANGYELLYFYDKYGKLESVYDSLQSSYLTKRTYDGLSAD